MCIRDRSCKPNCLALRLKMSIKPGKRSIPVICPGTWPANTLSLIHIFDSLLQSIHTAGLTYTTCQQLLSFCQHNGIRLTAVSYTHLPYTRPKGDCCRSATTISRKIRIRNSNITAVDPTNPSSSPTVQKMKSVSCSCLLYTSRCV